MQRNASCGFCGKALGLDRGGVYREAFPSACLGWHCIGVGLSLMLNAAFHRGALEGSTWPCLEAAHG